MPFVEILKNLWSWIADTGLDAAMWVVLGLLVPRIGRLAMRIIERGLKHEDENETKTHLAIAGVVIYLLQLIAYFVILIFLLKDLGFSLAGAAIPATAASAALALGAQSIVADFLAGFFILSERHYGVGDWVRFEGGSTTQEGTVIQITMRATRIRTLSEETVIIPNSEAGVSINNSNYWSSAVLVMPVPLLGSRSITQTLQRAEKAAQQALKNPSIAAQTLGELNMQEPVDVTPPTTVGMPWTVSLRFLCQVKPGSQWQVERAMRTAVIDEFWEEYGSAPTLTGAVANTLTAADPKTTALPVAPQTELADASNNATAPTQAFSAAPTTTTAVGDDTNATGTAGTGTNRAHRATETATLHAADSDALPPEREDIDLGTEAELLATKALQARSMDELPQHRQATEQAGSNLPDAQDPARRSLAASDPAAQSGNKKEEEADAAEPAAPQRGWKAKVHQVFTLGERTRVSTTVLVLLLFVILIFKGLTYSNADTDTSGWLAPDRDDKETTAEQTPEPTVEENTYTTPSGTETTNDTSSWSTTNQNSATNGTNPQDTANNQSDPQESAEPTPAEESQANPGDVFSQFLGSSSAAPAESEAATAPTTS